MIWDRPYYQRGFRPYIFYAVFGDCLDNGEVSRSGYEMPRGLEILSYKKSEHREYIQGFYSGYPESILLEKGRDFYEKIVGSEDCIVLAGEIESDEDLEYMRNTVGLVRSLMERGAAGVFDMQALRWYRPEQWEEYFFRRDEPEPLRHVSILSSEMEDGSLWIHTRGMRKFGRPDISILSVPERELEHAAEAARRFIVHQALGAMIPLSFTMKVEGRSCHIEGRYEEDFDNPDFNNAYYEFEWIRGVLKVIRGGR